MRKEKRKCKMYKKKKRSSILEYIETALPRMGRGGVEGTGRKTQVPRETKRERRGRNGTGTERLFTLLDPGLLRLVDDELLQVLLILVRELGQVEVGCAAAAECVHVCYFLVLVAGACEREIEKVCVSLWRFKCVAC